MKFNDLLETYEHMISYAERMMIPDCLSFYKKTKEYWHGYKYAVNRFFEDMKIECEDFNPTIQFQNLEVYYTDSNNNKFKAVGFLEYRNEIIYIFNDNNGQQLFALYHNDTISGGSFNLNCEYDICYQIDQIKDNIKF